LLLTLFFIFGHVRIYLEETYPESGYPTWLAVGWGILFLGAIFGRRVQADFCLLCRSIEYDCAGIDGDVDLADRFNGEPA